MIDRFSQFPRDLARRSRSVRLGPTGVPTLLAHPDWASPAPVMFWMHGRTVSKELDPGRYLRWIRAGIAAVAIDLPGHGERADASMHEPARILDILEQVIPEIDQVLSALSASEHAPLFDQSRLGIGGMSAGGMATLRRLCEPRFPGQASPRFRAAAVEGATGWLEALYFPERVARQPVIDGTGEIPASIRPKTLLDPDRLARLDPSRHIDTFAPIPLLVLHSQADVMVPWAGMRDFIERLRIRYATLGTPADMIEVVTWPETGAPQEHAGFGRFGNDAKNAQVEYLRRRLFDLPPEPTRSP